VLSSLGALIFGVSVALGQLTIGFAALLIGGLPFILLLMDDEPTGPGPGDVGDR
jgi:4-amino-4-deoxy-L-arabinose transferase-like glycosyltransferase